MDKKQMKARFAVPLLIALLGIAGTIAASTGFRSDARENWNSNAELTASGLSSSFIVRVEESYFPLSGVAALIRNSSFVSENEFHGALEGLEDRASDFFLNGSAMYRYDEKWPQNPWILTFTMGTFGIAQADLTEPYNQALLRALNVAKVRFGEFILGKPLSDDKGKPIGSPVALGISDTKGAMALVGLINIESLVDGLFNLHVPKGLGLQISARYPTAKGQSESLELLSRPIDSPLYSAKNRIISAGAEFVLTWTFNDTFEGGPPTRLTEFTMIGGIFSTLIISLFVGFLLRQNDVIKRKVDEATRVLAEKEEQLKLALDNMSDGLYMIGKDLRLQMFNDRYKVLVDGPDHISEIGSATEDALRFHAERGDFGEGDVEDLVKSRIDTITSGVPNNSEIRMKSGRTIQLRQSPLDDGGVVIVATDVTEIIEEQRSAKLLREALDNFTDMVILYDKNEQVVFTNASFHDVYPDAPSKEEIVNYSMEDILRRSLTEGYVDDPVAKSDPEKWLASRLESRRNNDAGSGESTLKDGRSYLHRYRRTTEGGVIFVQTEITGLKKAEAELRENETQFRSILEASPYGIIIISNTTMERLYTNPQVNQMFGATEGHMLQEQNVIDSYANIADYQATLLKLADRNAEAFEEEIERVKLDGTRIWCRISSRPITFDGKEARIVWHYDITKRKKAEEAIQIQSRQLNDILENVPQGIVLFDTDQKAVAWNTRYQEILGIDDDLIESGPTLKDLALFLAKRNYYGEGDLEELASQRVQKLWADNSQSEVSFDGDAIYEVRSTITPDDRLVLSYTDITEQKRAREELQQGEERMQLVLKGGDLGYWDVNLLDGTSVVNARWAEMLGYELSEVESSQKLWRELIHPDDKDAVEEIGQLYRHGEIPEYECEYRINNKNGQTKWLFSKGAMVEWDSDGKPARMVGTVTDITNRKQSEAALEAARDAAESATKAKAAFLATMSHEIRTPMNGVIGMVDLLLQSNLDGDQRQMAGTVQDSAYALLTIINDILDFSKIDAGKLELENIPFSISDAVEGVAEVLAPNARKKNIALNIHVDPDIPDNLVGDQVRIRQILFNLGGNAVKFTEQGKVLIRADLVGDTSGDVVNVCFRMRDSGIGISEEAKTNLFQAFSQAESSTTRRFGGTGLGLTICRRLANLMGGEIDVDSELGVGSTFSFTAAFPVAEDQSTKQDDLDLTGLNVLLQGSDQEICELDQKYINHCGADTVICTDVNALTDKVTSADKSKIPFDVVVLGSGNSSAELKQWIETLRSLDHSKVLRFVAMTKNRARTKANELINTVYVESDPLRRLALIRGVAIACGRASPDITYDQEDTQIVAGEPLTEQEAEEQGSLILVAEDNMTNQDVIGRQLKLLGYTAIFRDDGAQALEEWKSGRYGILLTDCHMPEMDGFELTQSIRKAEQDSDAHLPIIAITASALEAEVDRCYEAGMDDFLSKPLDMQKLKMALKKWVPRADTPDAEPPVGKSAPLPPAPPADTPTPGAGKENGAIDPKALTSVFGDDPETFKEILDDFVEPATNNVGEIMEAFEGRSSDGVAKAAHKLKSSSRAVGAMELADLCLALETAGKSDDWTVIETEIPRLENTLSDVKTYIASLSSHAE